MQTRANLPDLAGGLRAAYRDAFADERIAVASPAIAFPIAYLAAYGAGLLSTGARLGEHREAITMAVVVGFLGLILGLGLGWVGSPAGRAKAPQHIDGRVRLGALLLVGLGLAALALYLAAIGTIPLLLPSVEQARVEAAERGGAALRVTSLLALPGAWLLLGDSLGRRSRRWIALSLLLTAAVAATFLLTANRAHAFLTFEGAVMVLLLVTGWHRLRPLGLVLLAALVAALVVGAGLTGAVRLANSHATWRDPVTYRAGLARDIPTLTRIAILQYVAVPTQNFASTLTAVPELIGWRLGTTYLQPLGTVLPGKQTTFDQDLKVALGQTYAGGGTVPGLLGESYANFGPLGWLFVPTVLAFALARLYRWSSLAATPAAWALYGFAMLHVAGATISGLIVASVFPYQAIAILGFFAWVLPRLGRSGAVSRG